MWIWAAMAWAGPAAIPVGGELTEAQQDRVRKATYRPELEFLDLGTLTEAGLPRTLRAAADACEPWISEDQRGEIFEVSDEQGSAVYLAMPEGKDVWIWRFDPDLNTLVRVFSDPPDWIGDGSTTLLMVPWGTVPKLKKKQLKAWRIADSETLPADPEVIEALMRHPHECAPALDDAATEVFERYAANRSGEVFFGVLADRDLLVWHWDPETRSLFRPGTEALGENLERAVTVDAIEPGEALPNPDVQLLPED